MGAFTPVDGILGPPDSNVVTYQNIPTSSREEYTQQSSGDWISGEEIVLNGSFDNGEDDWILDDSGGTQTVEVVGGRAHIISDGSSANFRQNVLTEGRTYQGEMDIEVISGEGKLQLGSEGVNSSITERISHIFQDVSNNALFVSRNGACEFFADNVSAKRVLEYAGGDITPGIEEYKIDLDGTSSYYELEQPVTLIEDFEITFDFQLASLTADRCFLSDFLVADISFIRIDPVNGSIDMKIGGTFVSDDGAFIADKELHTLKAVRQNDDITIFLDDVLISTYLNRPQPFTVAAIGSRNGVNPNYFDGIISNVEMIDLSVSNNNTSFALNEPTANVEASIQSRSATPIIIPGKSSIDLYAATGIPVGTPLTVQNTGNQQVRVTESDVDPLASTGYNVLNPQDFLQSPDTPIGAWAINTNIGAGQLQVEEA